MKKLIIAAAALIVSLSAYGQGQFVFNNRVPPDIDAKIKLAGDTGTTSSLAGTAYTVQILGGKAGTAVGSLAPLGTTDFRSGAAAGYVNPLTVTVPGVPGGQSADILLKVFAGAGTSGNLLGSLGPFTVAVTEAPATPNNLPLGTNPLVLVPEPTTLALGALGIGALLMIRRRK